MTQGIYDDEYKEFKKEKVDAGVPSVTHLLGQIDGDGSIAMNAGINHGCLWQAPETGEYEVSATYHAWGGYSFGPPDDRNHKYTACSETNIAAIRNCDTVVASDTRPDLRIGRSGLASEVAESLLERLAYWLIKPYLGLIGKVIAKVVLSWAFDLDLRDGTEGGFPGDPLEEYILSTTFPAKKGETYNLQVTTSSGFSAQSDIDWAMFGEIQANHRLLSMNIRAV